MALAVPVVPVVLVVLVRATMPGRALAVPTVRALTEPMAVARALEALAVPVRATTPGLALGEPTVRARTARMEPTAVALAVPVVPGPEQAMMLVLALAVPTALVLMEPTVTALELEALAVPVVAEPVRVTMPALAPGVPMARAATAMVPVAEVTMVEGLRAVAVVAADGSCFRSSPAWISRSARLPAGADPLPAAA